MTLQYSKVSVLSFLKPQYHDPILGVILLTKMCIGNSGSYSCQIERIFSSRRLNTFQFQIQIFNDDLMMVQENDNKMNIEISGKIKDTE